jgi:hypothetical protein
LAPDENPSFLAGRLTGAIKFFESPRGLQHGLCGLNCDIAGTKRLSFHISDPIFLTGSCANSCCVIGLGGSGLVIGTIEVRKMESETWAE